MAETGYRGYVGTRPLQGSRTPQHVQNIVIRDYARRNNLHYLLSGVEYVMPGCYMMLEDLLSDLSNTRGVICYSLFMLPEDATHRRRIYNLLLGAKAELHAAVEDIAIRSEADIAAVEDLFALQNFITVME